MRSRLLGVYCIVLLTACSTHRGVVQEGRFQHRVHQRGWHIDLHRAQATTQTTTSTVPVRMDPHQVDPRSALMDPPERSLASTDRTILPSYASSGRIRIPATAQAGTAKVVRSIALEEHDDDEAVAPKKKWNKLAVPAFALSLGTVALALFTASTIAVILAAIATLILAGISLQQIRRREEAGKGFALIGLIVGLLASLITVAAIASSGFD